MTRARPVGDISLNETLWDIGSLNGNIILNQSIPNVTFNLINFNGQFILFTFEFLQFVQLFLDLFVRACGVPVDQASQGICNKDFLSIKVFLFFPDTMTIVVEPFIKKISHQNQHKQQLKETRFSQDRALVLLLRQILRKNDGYIRVTLLALGTGQEYYTTLNTEFPLFIWTIHSTVLKLQITHLPAAGCPLYPRCPRVRFLQSLGPAQGRGSCLAPGPGMSRSQWISHHIPPQQFSFRTHGPEDKQYVSNV